MSIRSSSLGLEETVSRRQLPAKRHAGPDARKFVRSVLTEPLGPLAGAPATVTEQLVEDATLLVDELVTNAVLHAGTDIEVVCRIRPATGTLVPGPEEAADGPDAPEPLCVLVEVVDRHPSSVVGGGFDARQGRRGHGLQLVAAISESWGVTYRRTQKVVWFALSATRAAQAGTHAADDGSEADAEALASPLLDPPADRTAEWDSREGPAFLAEASELLAGQLDEDMVTALAAQLLVPRLADWCGVWLSTDTGGMRLSRVWHTDEQRIDVLRPALEGDPPPARLRTTHIPWDAPEAAGVRGTGGSALAFPLVAGGVCQGVLLLGRTGPLRMTDAVARVVEDVARRVAQAVVTARQYTLQTTISRALQRRQLPSSLASIPGVETAIVYEPHSEGQTVGGDFYDLFPMGDLRWCFLLGDVQGKDPEAMSITGMTRHLVRLLAREGHGVESVLDRLNIAMTEESAEAVAFGGEHGQSRFLSLLYGELEPLSVTGGARFTVASAGHPLPLRLSADGTVAPPVGPQMLLGVDEGAKFRASTFTLAPGETLLCVTDGVTERRSGNRQLDDDDGLSRLLRGCAGLGAVAVAERVRQAAHDFGPNPVEDDLAVLVLHAVPVREK